MKKGSLAAQDEVSTPDNMALPHCLSAISGQLVAIVLLMLRRTVGIKIDPLIALPLGGFFGVVCMGKWRNLNQYALHGLGKMTPVAVMLLGTGALAGIIANSGLKDVLINGLTTLGLPAYVLAPVSGALMSMATASTTAGTAVAAS